MSQSNAWIGRPIVFIADPRTPGRLSLAEGFRGANAVPRVEWGARVTRRASG